MPTNEERISRARAALDAYPGDEPDCDETQMIDLVADLGHLAREGNIDFEKVLRCARAHIDAEIEEAA